MLAKKYIRHDDNHKYDFLNNIKSFDDIYGITLKMGPLEKGELFELITYYIFKLIPTLNIGIQDVWLYNDIPTKIIQELNLPEKDMGIDILLKKNNQYYSVQAKFRQDKNLIVPWGELATFYGLSFGVAHNIKGGYIVTNTINISGIVTRGDTAQLIYGRFFDELPDNFFKNMYGDINGYKVNDCVPKIFNPHTHQQACINKCIEHYKINTKGYIEMACGTGKTLTAYWIDKNLNNKLTIILVPTLQLLSQFYKSWFHQSLSEKDKIKYILVGSDIEVSQDPAFRSEGLELSLNTANIKRRIDNYKGYKTAIICTYQSSYKLFGALNIACMIFFDEAHRTVGDVDRSFSKLVKDNKKIKINKRLFVTATPKYYVKNKNEDVDDVASMDNEEYYGKKIYTYNTSSAIRDSQLTDYQLLTIVIHDKEIKDQVTSNKLVEYGNILEDCNASYIAFAIAILKKIHSSDCNHMVTFHNTIVGCKIFTKLLTKINNDLYGNDIYINGINGNVSMKKRLKTIGEFKESQKSILCSTRILNEGTDLPIIDSICFVDKKSSTVDIVQCIGRALRKYEGKKMANIIVPIFAGDVGDVYHGDCSEVVRVIGAMASADDCVAEYFSGKKENVQHRNIFRCEIHKHSKGYINKENLHKSIIVDPNIWKNKIELKVHEKMDYFGYMIVQLAKWTNEYNRLPIKTKFDDAESRLTQFCLNCRRKKKRSMLSISNIEKLENIDRWSWSSSKYSVDTEIYLEIKKWITENNRLPILSSSITEERVISILCSHILEKYNDKKLDGEIIDKFNKIGIQKWILNHKKYIDEHNSVQKWIDEHDEPPSVKGPNIHESLFGAWIQRLEKDLRIFDGKINSKSYDNYDHDYLCDDWENYYYSYVLDIYQKHGDDYVIIYNDIYRKYHDVQPNNLDLYEDYIGDIDEPNDAGDGTEMCDIESISSYGNDSHSYDTYSDSTDSRYTDSDNY